MKFLICLAIIAVAAASPSGPLVNSGSLNVQEVNEADAQPLQPVVGAELTRLRKAAYGGSSSGYGSASIPAPPCPRNYLFSCQPNLSPVACAAPSSSYGSQGAYSAPVPSYAVPVNHGGYGAPQGYAYNNQYYQY